MSSIFYITGSGHNKAPKNAYHILWGFVVSVFVLDRIIRNLCMHQIRKQCQNNEKHKQNNHEKWPKRWLWRVRFYIANARKHFQIYHSYGWGHMILLKGCRISDLVRFFTKCIGIYPDCFRPAHILGHRSILVLSNKPRFYRIEYCILQCCFDFCIQGFVTVQKVLTNQPCQSIQQNT